MTENLRLILGSYDLLAVKNHEEKLEIIPVELISVP